jgi:hypothetical protein
MLTGMRPGILYYQGPEGNPSRKKGKKILFPKFKKLTHFFLLPLKT